MDQPQPINYEFLYGREVEKPTALQWIKHILLLAATFCTMSVTGVISPYGPYLGPMASEPETDSIIAGIAGIPGLYFKLIYGAVELMAVNQKWLIYGVEFAASLLFILICHEMGHYIACRIYKVDATLPFFIPTPPLIAAGTFGAFIKIRSPLPSRRAVFDIGVAGPIAGFIAIIPVCLIGVATMHTYSPELAGHIPAGPVFTDQLLPRIFAYLFGVDLRFGIGNPFYFASWFGLLVTALNLIPSGQLDGGHAMFAVFGEAVHRWTGRIAFLVMLVLSVSGAYFFSSPSGFLVTIILGIMLRVKHPQPLDQTPLDAKRKLIALLTLVIFILSFVPFPIVIN